MLSLVNPNACRDIRPPTKRHPVKTLQQNDDRVEQYLVPRMRRLRQWIARVLTDSRCPQGLRICFDSLSLALVAGLMADCEALLDVERLSARLGLGRRGGNFRHRRKRKNPPS